MRSMRTGTLLMCISLLPCVSGHAQRADGSVAGFLDFRDCDFVIEEVTMVDEIRDGRRTIKAHDRHLRLVEVKLSGRASASGVLIWHPQTFGVLCDDKGKPYGALSRAVGLKIEKNGEPKEYWSFPDRNATVSVYHDLEAGEQIVLFVAFDVPENARSFHVQVPSIVVGPGEVLPRHPDE